MAEADWDFLTGVLSASDVLRGVTSGITAPNGGGDFTFGFNSVNVVTGAVGLIVNLADFAPIDHIASKGGGSISAAVRRHQSGGSTGFSPFVFIGGQGNSVSDSAYILGLEDNNPYRIVLRKGTIQSGVPAAVVDNSLRRSVEQWSTNEWVHFRLDMIVNEVGAGEYETLLKVYENDLGVNPVTAPVWALVPFNDTWGDYFPDDKLGVNSGSVPFSEGYVGFGFQVSDTNRRVFFDHVKVARQTP